ncbi:MAG: RNA degradosome polyphosphate kinase [Clostridiales bacterium]|jgi:polyphosphate kinase|nr:RNA degradosome polyphosphate kinase [Clostridiales bacterium]
MDLSNPNFYFNRELSWLEFNDRVLEEAQDKSNLLMERLKFLAITASNLDEFFMVRVSNLWDQDGEYVSEGEPTGLTPLQQLHLLGKKAHEMVNRQYSCLNRSILPALEREGISFLEYSEINERQRDMAERYFKSTIYPILTPMAIDSSRPFPLLNNRTINIIVELTERDKNSTSTAVLQIPTVVSRIIALPSDGVKQRFIMLEDLIIEHIDDLFEGYEVHSASLFRIMRNSDLSIDEEDTEDLLGEMEKSIKRRRWGAPVRLEVQKSMSRASRAFLEETLELEAEDIYELTGPLDLTVWMNFSSLPRYDNLRNIPLPPQPNVDFLGRDDLFEVIRERDVLVHHPYESFDCVVNFVKESAADPNVLAIKQTLYRVSGNSPIVNALIQAAENGKQVTVLVELKARFDEENNIIWAKKLEKSGCHVVYGLMGLKIHCKICLVVRREDDGIRRYIHLGTGNYNDSTAKIYTDLGFFTCKETFGADVSKLFNTLTGFSIASSWNKLAVAPLTLRDMFLKYINKETQNANEGKDACILAKLNSLVDIGIIQALYRASIAGVRIRLIVRGICCLKSGIEGVSDNIIVMSIVDRFLEHSRIYYFENAGNPKLFLSSADWMPRNLDRRVEVAFPIEDTNLKEQLVDILETSMSDTVKLRVQQSDGSYERVDRRGKEHIQSQLRFYHQAVERVREYREKAKSKVFEPILHGEIL